ncbi:MAG: alanine--tRNA ligase, partial [Planctomycetes bacterium]|nr:alanine--tRNA ligase [Planctomycetota bacterium]
MNAQDIRSSFLHFFEENGHTIVPSSSIVPAGDASLLFVNAGMNQFKDVFTGQAHRPYTRASSSQKCVRVGGKHNDLENVGRTARHQTFFEMLGNFSFGDYFKEEAISFAWRFLTGVLELPKDKLWVTVHVDDDEADALWKKIAGLDASRIYRLDKDNFWAMGDTGPCGPCSEIHFNMENAVVNNLDDFVRASDLGQITEIWNLVFMQFEQKADGARVNLPKPSIDTGMGLERLSVIMQGVKSNYDTDLFTPLLRHTEEICSKPYSKGEDGLDFRVLADHSKASAFLIADGILPSNEGRGYALRRIMRRAIRHAWLLGMREPVLARLLDTVVDIYGQAYPELIKKKDLIRKSIEGEEKRFLSTIDQGITLFERGRKKWSEQGRLPGDDAFKLYDTFGFPLDLTQLMAAQEGLAVDQEGFDACMEAQKTRAREASMFKTGKLEGLHWTVLKKMPQQFTAYTAVEELSEILRYARTAEGQLLLIPERCCFYGESGGQVGDCGTIELHGNEVSVVDCQVVEGMRCLILDPDFSIDFEPGTAVRLAVDTEARLRTMANHTCTHLLHSALKDTLGEGAEQKGSWVGPTHLRFDFPYEKAVEKDTLKIIEDKVNTLIRRDLPVRTTLKSHSDAIKEGATALFGEKYGEEVRVVEVAGCSKELCG